VDSGGNGRGDRERTSTVLEMREPDWQRLIHQLRNGDCTPFIGAGACHNCLPTGGELSREMAERWGYPYSDVENLSKVTQFGAMRYGDALYVKEMICKRLSGIGPPDSTGGLEPHSMLARFPLPVYLTTNYDDFMVQSLRTAGKRPNTALCPWNTDIDYAANLFDRKSGWDPQPESPLVYHLHGSLQDRRHWSSPRMTISIS